MVQLKYIFSFSIKLGKLIDLIFLVVVVFVRLFLSELSKVKKLFSL